MLMLKLNAIITISWNRQIASSSTINVYLVTAGEIPLPASLDLQSLKIFKIRNVVSFRKLSNLFLFLDGIKVHLVV